MSEFGEVKGMIEEAQSALRTGSCFIAPAAAKDLIERLVATLDKRNSTVEDVSGESLERFYKIEKLEQDKAKLMELIKDYVLISIDNKRLVRELDVLLNGEDGAAKQASLCDIVAQLNSQKLAKHTPTTS